MKGFQDCSPTVSLTVLGTLCFVTLVMCQTRFKVSKELSQHFQPPILRTKDSWFLYTVGNPDSFKCVLRAFIVVTSPVLSFISTALLLLGKVESNPYFFIPWLFLTIKGLLLIQIDSLITIIRDLGNRKNFVYGFRFEDFKWLVFYSSIFMIDLIEVFSFCEIFDLFLVIWNHHPGYDIKSVNIEVVKKEISDIVEALSKCSLGSLSKISLASTSDVSEDNSESNLRKISSIGKLSINLKDKERTLEENELPKNFFKGVSSKVTVTENDNLTASGTETNEGGEEGEGSSKQDNEETSSSC